MNLAKLILRSAVHYWRSNLAVAAGAAVGVAVITGSLLIGDSATGSLRHLALQRLAGTDHALISPRFLRQTLADDLATALGPAAPHGAFRANILLDATALDPRSEVALPRVTVLGIDPARWHFADGRDAPVPEGREVLVNRALADDLGVTEGQSVLLRFRRATAGRAGTLFGRRDPEHTVQTVRVTVARVVPDRGPGRFSLRGDRPRPRNVYASLTWLQQQLRVEGRVNLLRIVGDVCPDSLADALARSATLDDYRLRLVLNHQRRILSVESRDMVLTPAVVEAALHAAERLQLASSRASVYLANRIVLEPPRQGKRPEVPYSIIAAVDLAAPAPFGPLPSADGRPIPRKLAPGDILLNAWTADALKARAGDVVRVTCYRVRADGTLGEGDPRPFTVRGIVALDGPAADPGLVPEFEGVTDADDMKAWDPPFDVDTRRIKDADEDYWVAHRATPKAFISSEAARELWRPDGATPAEADRLPWITSVRVAVPPDDAPETVRQKFQRELLAHLPPGAAGLAFRPVKAEALHAAAGSTDFASLFLGMGFFLVVAAALLVALLMRLSAEQRARQIGTLLAVGFPPRTASRLVVCEGLVIAVVATLVGVPLGVVYARGIIWALATMWVDALGPFSLSLHVGPLSLVTGGAAGLAVATAAVWWSARVLRKTDTLTLLGGWRVLALPAPPGRRRAAGAVALAAAILAAVVLAVLAPAGALPATAAFFVGGALLLVAGLAAVLVVLTPARLKGPAADRPRLSLPRLAARDAARQRLRSTLTAGLVATAAFAIVAVAANRVDLSAVPMTDRSSGTGGFALVARADLPVFLDPATPAGRAALGFDDRAEAALHGADVISLRIRSGDDASCLNLQRPLAPQVVGVPAELIHRNAFAFAAVEPPAPGAVPPDNPWHLLEADLPGGQVPAFGDEASVKWILHAALGDTVTVPGPGGDVTLRLVGLLRGSIWQSELLIADQQFRRHFGSDDGYRAFLVDVNPAGRRDARMALARSLADVGLDVRRPQDILAQYAGVQNAYLSTFQTLGALGLALGTFAVVTVLLRSIVERRSELAMMLALGLRRRQVVTLVTLENVVVVAMGLAIGAAAGLIAVAPHLAEARADVPWASIALTLAAILAVAFFVCRTAAGHAVGRRLLEAIRSE